MTTKQPSPEHLKLSASDCQPLMVVQVAIYNDDIGTISIEASGVR